MKAYTAALETSKRFLAGDLSLTAFDQRISGLSFEDGLGDDASDLLAQLSHALVLYQEELVDEQTLQVLIRREVSKTTTHARPWSFMKTVSTGQPAGRIVLKTSSRGSTKTRLRLVKGTVRGKSKAGIVRALFQAESSLSAGR